jgi:triacylglycerol esterase/lipase EstA (alpha/beta hydrolase family)
MFLSTKQVLEVIGERPEINKISFIAHSIGGLVARYAIARLYRPRTGDICGLEPINFVAVATPHLGSRGNKQVSFSFPSILYFYI